MNKRIASEPLFSFAYSTIFFYRSISIFHSTHYFVVDAGFFYSPLAGFIDWLNNNLLLSFVKRTNSFTRGGNVQKNVIQTLELNKLS